MASGVTARRGMGGCVAQHRARALHPVLCRILRVPLSERGAIAMSVTSVFEIIISTVEKVFLK